MVDQEAIDDGFAILRDNEGREVDFVVTFNWRVHWLIEVKPADVNPSTRLRYYTGDIAAHESLQLVLNRDRAQANSGIKLLPWRSWLEALPYQMYSA